LNNTLASAERLTFALDVRKRQHQGGQHAARRSINNADLLR
jgi:hypothetical protein